MGGTAELSPWERLQQMVHTENLVSEVPALEIFLKDGVGVSGAGSFDTTPSCSTSPCLKDHAKTVLLALHLAYEVYSMSVPDITPPTNQFLFSVCMATIQLTPK